MPLNLGTRRTLLGAPSTYIDKVKGIESSNLIGYWPMNENTGSVAYDFSIQVNNGAYTGVDLAYTAGPDGQGCPYFDGTNDYNNIYSAGLSSDFDGDEGTIALWIKVSAAGVWTDGTVRTMMRLRADAENYVEIYKSNTNNALNMVYEAGNTMSTRSITSISDTGWFCLTMTWSASADEVNYYKDGTSVATKRTGLGTWAGSLTSGFIGAQDSVPLEVWDGYLAHGAVWTTPLTAAQIASLAAI
jgi:hypothetical protein